MPWIMTVPPGQALDELAQIYDAIGAARGGVAEIHQIQSLNPRALRAHLELYKAVIFGRSPLDRMARERIGVAVSAANECRYCVAHHGEALRRLGDDAAVVEGIGRGEVPDGLPPAEQTLLRWVTQAARRPAACTEADIAELRCAGFDDRAILDATLTIAYFSFVNRLVLLLGVVVEEDFETTCGDSEHDAR